jgi:hypothetical protein
VKLTAHHYYEPRKDPFFVFQRHIVCEQFIIGSVATILL